jgi:hypothetical protein
MVTFFRQDYRHNKMLSIWFAIPKLDPTQKTMLAS